MLCLLINLLCKLCGIKKYPTLKEHPLEYYVSQESTHLDLFFYSDNSE